MGSLKTSSLGNALRNQDLTLELEVPLGASDSCSSTPSISLGPVKIPLGTSTQPGLISPPSRKDLEAIGNSDSQAMTGDPLP